MGDFDVWSQRPELIDQLFLGLELYPKEEPTYRFVTICVNLSGRAYGVELTVICMRICSRTLKLPDDVTVKILDMSGLYSKARDGRLFWPDLRLKAERYESTEEDILQYLTSSHQEIREYGARLLAKLPTRQL